MDLLKSMEIFVRVAERGSFSRAATELHLTQPAVSRQINQLEKELGVQLFQRTTRSLNLTDQGTRFYLKSRDVLQAAEEARNLMKADDAALSGQLKIAAPVAFGLRRVVPLLWGFQAEHPQVKLDVMLSDHFVDLVEEGVDLSIRLGKLEDSTLKARHLGHFPRHLVASPQYLAEHGTPTTLEALQQHRLIHFSLSRIPNKWVFHQDNKRIELPVSGHLRINNADGILQAVLAHQGIAMVPPWLCSEELKDGRLIRLLKNYAAEGLDLHIVFPPGRFAPRAVKVFAEYLGERLRSDWAKAG